MRVLSFIKRLSGRFVRDENGTATIEFVILFPAIMTLFLSSVEVGFYLTRTVLLERALDINVRALRLGMLDPSNAYSELKTHVCEDALIFGNCPNSVKIELSPISRNTWAMPNEGVSCVDRDAPVSTDPPEDFSLGGGDQIMMVRACVVQDPFFSTTPFVMSLPQDSTGGVAIVAASTYVNEP